MVYTLRQVCLPAIAAKVLVLQGILDALGEYGADAIQRLGVMGKPTPYDLQNGERFMFASTLLKAAETRRAPRFFASEIIGFIFVHGRGHDGSVVTWL